MTFKHVKFEDSPTMRALEKVAREKGLVKPEPLSKKASLVKKADLTPSDNLMENIVKLCTGLREKGLVKDAAELETNYMRYKQAQTLYETSKETGEDVLEQAHPEGSHKLLDVDSVEAVVEDLLDKHDLIEDVAEKEPKAKLSDAKSVIKAVKTVLAAPTLEQLYASASRNFHNYRSVMGQIAMKMGEGANFNAPYLDNIQKVLDEKTVHKQGRSWGSAPFANVLISEIDDFKSYMEPSYFNPFDWGGPSAYNNDRNQAWNEVQKHFVTLKKYADLFQSDIQQIDAMEAVPAKAEEQKEVQQWDPEGAFDALKADIKTVSDRVTSDMGKATTKKLPDIVTWLNTVQGVLARYSTELDATDRGEDAVKSYTAKLEDVKGKLSRMEAQKLQ